MRVSNQNQKTIQARFDQDVSIPWNQYQVALKVALVNYRKAKAKAWLRYRRRTWQAQTQRRKALLKR